jgi:hypothetical protein
MSLFRKTTCWVPLATYNTGGSDYIVFARRNLKTGMIYFKTKNISPRMITSYLFAAPLVDIKQQFTLVCTILADAQYHPQS